MTQRISQKSSATRHRRCAGPRADPDRARPARFIGSDIYRTSSYGARHPLAIPRVSTCIDLCRALAWLPAEVYLESPRATPAELARFHDPAYIEALIESERSQSPTAAVRRRFNIGRDGNPIFPDIFRRPATACGGSILGAKVVRDGGVAYNPAGGTHHGRPDRASGFCYLNDPVLAILAMLDDGLERVLYLDVDAHHGDGVQAAFAEDRRVLTVSVHEAGRWPMPAAAGHLGASAAGSAADRAGGMARNLPVPPGFNDSEMAFLLEAALLPLAGAFDPEAVVLQCGADALEEDPLSRLSLSNLALWQVVSAAKGLAPRLLVLGGGGYNPWSVGRCWAGVWATLNGFSVPDRLPPAGEAVLRGLTWRHSRGRNPPDHWFTTLADRPRPGPVRQQVRALADAVMAPAGGL
jgi:acetoin utilization protein AcuC